MIGEETRDVTVSENEQVLSEDERINVTKEALALEWYEKLEDW